MFKNLILIALGGGLGSVIRYLANLNLGKIWPFKMYFATLLVNIIGCFLTRQSNQNIVKFLL